MKPIPHLPCVCALFLTYGAIAQPITVPQQSPYANDANTVLLQHFDGTTSGSANGSVTYTNGVFGQGVHLNDGSWVSWNLGALSQGTVEFWGKLDTLDYGGSWPTFIQSDYSQFFASTFYTEIVTNRAISGYHCGCNPPGGNDWVGMTTNWSSAVVTPNVWHHYATTWGSQGFHFYFVGTLIYSNANSYAQNPATAFWAIGGLTGGGPASGPGFTGVVDELRISNIQRTFRPANVLSIETAAVRLRWFAQSNVTYQVQWSTNLLTWSNLTLITGFGNDTNVVDWTDGPRKFYRVMTTP